MRRPKGTSMSSLRKQRFQLIATDPCFFCHGGVAPADSGRLSFTDISGQKKFFHVSCFIGDIRKIASKTLFRYNGSIAATELKIIESGSRAEVKQHMERYQRLLDLKYHCCKTSKGPGNYFSEQDLLRFLKPLSDYKLQRNEQRDLNDVLNLCEKKIYASIDRDMNSGMEDWNECVVKRLSFNVALCDYCVMRMKMRRKFFEVAQRGAITPQLQQRLGFNNLADVTEQVVSGISPLLSSDLPIN